MTGSIRSVRTAMLGATVALVAASPWIVAQEDEAATAHHAPYMYVIDSRVEPEVMSTWSKAVAATVEAHARHDDGFVWTAFRALTGGPEVDVRFAFPIHELGELDTRQSNRQIVIESLGADLGKRVLKGLDLETQSQDRIMALSSEVLYVVPFERFAELDGWPLEGEVLTEVYGEVEAARIEQAIHTITRTETRLWTLVPEMSRFPSR